ncbi:MAG TPA: hypothetical protein VLE27_06490 [Thermoanaerobaculia bacterium]|nr:hypothetical protein [Thermoanaerobaculia bacterium]
MSPGPLNPLETFLDSVGRATLPFITPQTCALAALMIFVGFCWIKLRQDQELPSVDDCLRVALSTVTLLTAVVSTLGLLLPTPPAPPEMNPGVVRGLGLASAVALSSYAGKSLLQLFSRKTPD